MTAGPGPFPPGATREFDVTSHGGDKYLSTAWMLVRTNDAFTGLDSYKLDGRKGRTKTLMLGAYDGGTERNNHELRLHPGSAVRQLLRPRSHRAGDRTAPTHHRSQRHRRFRVDQSGGQGGDHEDPLSRNAPPTNP